MSLHTLRYRHCVISFKSSIHISTCFIGIIITISIEELGALINVFAFLNCMNALIASTI